MLKRAILTNSITSTQMDSMKVASGFLALGTASGALVFGHLLAHSTNEGVGLNTSGVAGAAMGSYAGTYLTASDNQTVGKVKGECDISKHTVYSGTPDATIGTTTGSNLLGYYTDLIDEDQIDESDAETGIAQYFIWGVDPSDTTRGLYSIVESSVFGV